MDKTKLAGMIEAFIFAVFALVLDLLPSIQLAPTLSISLAMVPIFILAFRWGMTVSLLAGFLWGLLQLIFDNGTMLTPLQVIIDYFIAFSLVGFSGIYYQKIQKNFHENKRMKASAWVIFAIFSGSFARYVAHFISGVIFWADYAPKGASLVNYSLAVNGSIFLSSFILSSIIIVLLLRRAPSLIFREEKEAPVNKRTKLEA